MSLWMIYTCDGVTTMLADDNVVIAILCSRCLAASQSAAAASLVADHCLDANARAPHLTIKPNRQLLLHIHHQSIKSINQQRK
jgi:hypothetical protein